MLDVGPAVARTVRRRLPLASKLAPLDRLWGEVGGETLPLPTGLRRVYGPLQLPRSQRPHVIANFATTIDGVVSLSRPGVPTGGEITGFDPQDRFVMGLLRAVADVVVFGAGTFRGAPGHTWNAEHAYPGLAEEFRTLRHRLGLSPVPLNVLVTASGRIDLGRPLFTSGEVPVLVLTTGAGARRLRGADRLPSVEVVRLKRTGPLRAAEVLVALRERHHPRTVLIEGGPHLLGTFLSEGELHELFLTLAPQIAGRNGVPRPGLVAGKTFAPADPLWGRLSDVRKGARSLFLRFSLADRAKVRPRRDA